MSNVIVKAGRKINPYQAGKIAIIAATYLAVSLVNYFFWHMTFTFEGVPDDNLWVLGAILAGILHLAATGIIGYTVYDYLDTKARNWEPYEDG